MSVPRYDPTKMLPSLDLALGILLMVCSLIAVVGNLIAVTVMTGICRSGSAKFSTIIFLNIAIVNLVIPAVAAKISYLYYYLKN